MKLSFLLIALLCCATAEGAVFKWVDDQGETHFGDRAPDNVEADRVELPRLQTYSAPPATTSSDDGAVAPKQPGHDDRPFAGYKQISIVQPLPDATFRVGGEQIVVQVAVEPALRPGHMLAFFLDGKQVGEPASELQIGLQGVVRGKHSVRAVVVDGSGKTLGTSPSVDFYLRQASVLIHQP